ncbi:MAG: immunoglobulin domain-containing protein [Verrucomicrobiales bacterium]|nr:immunoglobulin domain-containing protein [Verrucomicrobiales bacterium]
MMAYGALSASPIVSPSETGTSGTGSIYVNGVENAPPQAIGGNGYVPNTTAPLRIGAGNPAGAASLFFPGWMDEVAVYPYALSSSQITAHYTAATANPAGYAALIAGDQPTGYWRFNEPPLPPEPVPVSVVVANQGSWGASANGTFNSGGMSSGVPGVPYAGFGAGNTACQFTGTSESYIEIPAQNLLTDSWTVTCWAKRNGVSEYWNMLYSSPADLGQPTAGPSHPVTGVGFGNGGNPENTRNDLRMYWAGTDANTGNYGATPSPALYMPDQQWTFVAMVASPSNIVMYMNGQAATHTPTTPYGAHDFSTVASFIGKKQKYNGWDSGGEVNGFRGTIDEVAIFDQALTEAQIRQLLAAAEVPPIILVQPQAPPPPVYEGMTLSLSVLVDEHSSTAPLEYQWTKNGDPMPGQTTANLTVSSLVTSDTGNYAVVVSNAFGSVTSSTVALTVLAGPPLIAQPPQSIQRYAGATATFSVTAYGSIPLSYQWSLNSTPISGATSSSYTVTDVRAGEERATTTWSLSAYGTVNANASLTLLSATKLAAVVTERTPFGYWRMDETSGTLAYDYWGGRDGTLRTGVTGNAPGPEPAAFQGFDTGNTAYELNGNGGYVTVPPFGAINGAMTIVAWIKPDAVQSDWAGLVYTRGDGGSTSGLQFTQGGQLGYNWNDAAASYNWQSGLYPTADEWNFVALVVEPTQATLYLDSGFGLQPAVNTLNHGTATWSGVRFGSDPYGGRDYRGSLDDVAVYAYALPADEIENIRKAGVEGIYTPAKLFRWKGAGGANWSVAGNWNDTVPGASDTAVLSDSSSAGATINLNTDVTVGGLRFNNKVANQTIASTSGRTLALSGGDVEVHAGRLSISCPIDATANGFTKSGSGVLNIAGPMEVTYQPPNEWTFHQVGGIELSGTGSWTVANDFPVMDVVGTVTVNDNATLDWSSSVSGIALRGGETGVLVQNGGLVKGKPVGDGWACCSGPGFILGGKPDYWGGTGASTAEYVLNGGILLVASIYNMNGAWDTPPAPPNGSAVFRFNGGILRATQADATDPGAIKEACTNLIGNLSHAYVGLGGAKIDVATFSCGINQALEHDPALGATPDGGLRAMSTGGPGTLALYKLSSFTGPLAIDTGVTVRLGYAGDQQVAGVSIGGVDQGTGTFGVGHKNPNGVFAGTGTVTVASAPPPPPTLPASSFSIAGGVPTFTDVPTTVGYTYWLTYKNRLTDAAWIRIGAGTAGGGNKTFTDNVTAYPAYRFYRLEFQ